MNIRKTLLVSIVALLLFGGVSEAYGQKWKLISATTATRRAKRHTAVILKKHDDIRSIKLKALNAAVKVWDMTIHYRNGESQAVSLPAIIYRNAETPSIRLDERGGIRSISFYMNAVTFSKKTAVIWIYGR